MSPKRLKDSEGEGDSKVDGNKSNTGAKVNDVAGAELKAEAQESAPEGGQLTAEKVRAPRPVAQEKFDVYVKLKGTILMMGNNVLILLILTTYNTLLLLYFHCYRFGKRFLTHLFTDVTHNFYS